MSSFRLPRSYGKRFFHGALACPVQMRSPTVRRTERQQTPNRPASTLLPTPLVLSAHKSKALPFGPSVVLPLLDAYPIRNPPSRAAGEALCAAHDITASNLTTLAKILLRAPRDEKSDEQLQKSRVAYARHMLATASHQGDGGASAELYHLLTRATRTTQKGVFVRQEGKFVFSQVQAAADAGHAECMMIVGNELLRANKVAEGRVWLRRAGEGGLHEAWEILANSLLASGEKLEAMNVFSHGVQAGSVACAWQLGDTTAGVEGEDMLIQAAARGSLQAAMSLGMRYWKLGNVKLAEEWFLVGADEGHSKFADNLKTLLQEIRNDDGRR